MPRRPPWINRRQRVFVACEGSSELGYARFIEDLSKEARLPLHFVLKDFEGGDHLVIVEKAVKWMKRRAEQHGQFWKKAIFLDSDRRGEHPERTRQADKAIEESGLLPIWSTPCLEALLLRHFPGRENAKPPTSNSARRELRRHWKEYKKGASSEELHARFDIDHVRRAAGTNPGLLEFLIEIGFPGMPSA